MRRKKDEKNAGKGSRKLESIKAKITLKQSLMVVGLYTLPFPLPKIPSGIHFFGSKIQEKRNKRIKRKKKKSRKR